MYNPAVNSLHLHHSIFIIKYNYIHMVYKLCESHTNSHLGLGHIGLANFQSQFDSVYTDWNSSLGA